MAHKKSTVENLGLNYASQKILVTGGAGFIGSHLTQALINQHARVVVYDSTFLPRSYFQTQLLRSHSQVIKADVRNFQILERIVKKYKIGLIFHLAAQTQVEYAYQNPRETLETNVMGTVNVLEVARINSCVKMVVMASSDKAYGKLDNRGKYKENDPLRGNQPYEVSKLSAETIAQSYIAAYQIPLAIARFGNVYGEGDLSFNRLIPGIMKAVLLNKKFFVRSDGTYIRDYIYVGDAVTGYLLLGSRKYKISGEIFNFGSLDTYSVKEVIAIAQQTLTEKINFVIQNRISGEIPYQSLDFSKAKKILGWKPKSRLAATIPSIFTWYQKYFST